METRLTVGQLAQKYNISARAIRHYENLGLIESSRDEESNYRIYGENESERLSQIILFKGMGFSLKEISAIITSEGKKNTIVSIIRNRLRSLEKKSIIYSNCIKILNEFLEVCSNQADESIDSIGLLSGLDSIRVLDESAAATNKILPGKKLAILKDKDLDVLKLVRAEDFNALYLPFILGQEDADILENFFINHRRYFGLNNVILSDGKNLSDIYNSYKMAEIIKSKIADTLLNSEGNELNPLITYKEVVQNLCDIIVMNMEFEPGESIEVIELKLAVAIFMKAIEILEFSDRLSEENIKMISKALELELTENSARQLKNAITDIYHCNGRLAYNLIQIVNSAVKRQVLAGLFLAMTDYDSLNSKDWLLDRALDMAVRFIWSHDIEVIGQPYKTLTQVITQIALIRARNLYVPTSYIIPEIVYREETKIIGISVRTTEENGLSDREIPEMENKYFEMGLAEFIPGRINPGIRIGAACRYEDNYFTFITGEEVQNLEYIPEGMTGEVLPAGTYAVFTIRGGPFPYRVIEMNSYAYQTWLPASDYQYDFRPHLLIGEREVIGKTGCVDSFMKVCIPVRLKEESV
ncbi:MAG: hypothetical protein K0R50_608 [Eubacterium sp.]|nr:hypothetical protein [Eubacterium sp.]